MFKDEPVYDDARRFGREWRESKRMEYNEETSFSD
jgi:hypothetical protein